MYFLRNCACQLQAVEQTTFVNPKPTLKQNPNKMQTTDFPPGFTPTNVTVFVCPNRISISALFVHIKILWGLLKQYSVPKLPKTSKLEEF
ncbi:hypothetical protein VP01_2498g1 [Puccinia sorghi]|uniref:Uncharacterized protein n=1 Tax=Puccinia sorghi TaxID=27349 RepID=A0A0L6V7K6_9BASI|nr:hypothetical protein VP01_2498g1 [Puccinia sorghi]